MLPLLRQYLLVVLISLSVYLYHCCFCQHQCCLCQCLLYMAICLCQCGKFLTTNWHSEITQRQDLLSDCRELVYSGNIGWKSARGRVYDVLAVVLTDLIVFLQKNEQKYTFLMQDNKVRKVARRLLSCSHQHL